MLDRIKDVLWEFSATDRELIDKMDMDFNLKANLELDSLDLVEVVLGLEEEFDVSIPDRSVMEWQTVGDIVEFLSRCQSEGKE